MQKTSISIIIPAYNEEEGILMTIEQLKEYLHRKKYEFEIIVVNDASKDKTFEILSKINDIKIINHPYNKGYGAAIKTGAAQAKYDWLLLFDADGQHNPGYIDEMVDHCRQYDIVIGARQGYKGPLIRQPGKKIIHLVANYLTGEKIPDLNCGLRLIKKELFLRYRHILPDGFSLSTTTTLAFFKEGLNVKYVPVIINKRLGKSTLKTIDGFKTLMLIVRLIMLFSPLKIFVPLAMAGFIASFSWIIRDLVIYDFSLISKSAWFLMVISILIFLFGLLADQVAAIRRHMR